MFVLHQLQARLREIAGVRLRLVGRNAEIRVLDVRQGGLERHLLVQVHVRGRLERRAGADQVELDVRKARGGVLEERVVEQHRADGDGVHSGGVGARPDRGEVGGVDPQRHDIGLVRGPLEVVRHLFRQQAEGIDVAGAAAQFRRECGRRADRVQRVRAAIDDARTRVEPSRAMDEHDAQAGFDDDVRGGAQCLVDEAVRQRRVGRERRSGRAVHRGDAGAERVERRAPQIACDAVDRFRPVGAFPQEQAVVAFGAGDEAEAHRDERDLVAETH